MNATQIANALQKAKSPNEITLLIQACGPRAAEIRARLTEIGSAHPYFETAERKSADLAGPAAVQKLDVEIEELEREGGYLNTLELKCNEALEAALNAEAAREVPAACKRLPKHIEQVRQKLAALDAAIEEINKTVETIANYPRIPGSIMPLFDDELAALLQIRQEVWTVRNIRSLHPNPNYPLSEALFFDKRPNGTFSVRTAKPWPLDMGEERFSAY